MNCTCRSCRADAGIPCPRFYFNHEEMATLEIDIDAAEPHETITTVIHGDPIPYERGVDELWYSENEMESLKNFFDETKRLTPYPPAFEAGEEIQVEITFLVLYRDLNLPLDMLRDLSYTISQLMVGVFYNSLDDVKEIFTLQHAAPDEAGMIVVNIKNLVEYDEE